MKKSSQVPATLIVALASGVAVGGCSSSYNECVDPYGQVVSDYACSSGGGGGHWVHVRSGGFGGSGGGGGFFGG